MSENPEGNEIKEKAQQITFGSEISFRTVKSKHFFIYCDGYIDSKLTCISLTLGEANQVNYGRLRIKVDMEKSVFRIMPFQGSWTFRYMTKVQSFLSDFEIERKKLAQLDLEVRKEEISDLRQRFFDEILTNISTYDKAKNTPVMYNSTVFVLVHKISMKFLSLRDEGNDVLK